MDATDKLEYRGKASRSQIWFLATLLEDEWVPSLQHEPWSSYSQCWNLPKGIATIFGSLMIYIVFLVSFDSVFYVIVQLFLIWLIYNCFFDVSVDRNATASPIPKVRQTVLVNGFNGVPVNFKDFRVLVKFSFILSHTLSTKFSFLILL